MNGSVARMSVGIRLTIRRMPASATTRASPAPMATSTPASVTKWRTIRAREAPSASRTDSSRRRDSVRTSSRLTTLMQAMPSSSAAPPSSSHSVGRMLPTMTSAKGPTTAPWLRFESGYWRSSCLAITAIAAPASSIVTPGFRRPTPSRLWQLRRAIQPPLGSSGVQNSAPSLGANWKVAGNTPTMVWLSPLSVTLRPTMPGSEPKRSRHVRCVMIASRNPAALASASLKVRPRAGWMPSVRKKPPLTCMPGTITGPPGVPSMCPRCR
jgi:hypothetical protein